MGLLNTDTPEERIKRAYEAADSIREQIIAEIKNERDWITVLGTCYNIPSYKELLEFKDRYADDVIKLNAERLCWSRLGETIDHISPTTEELELIRNYIIDLHTKYKNLQQHEI